MAETLIDVRVFGFEDAELGRWPEEYGLRPHCVAPEDMLDLPEDEPLVVHARRGAEATRTLETVGRGNDIILYLPQGQVVPRGVYYEAKITDAELPALRALLAHPQQFRMRELAEAVPLRLLARPVQTIDFGDLDLPEQASRHLSGCCICERALREALHNRVLLYQRMFCPGSGALIAYALEGRDADGLVRSHVVGCPLCGPQVAALRAALVPGRQ